MTAQALSMMEEPPGAPGRGPATAPAVSGSLEELFRRHSKRVFRAAYRVTGNLTDAEDVVQTIFLRLLKRDDDLDLGATAGSYLHRAAVNAGLDTLRSRRRARAVDLEDQDPSQAALQTPENLEPGSRAEQRQDARFLRECLARLNPRSAEVFALRYVEGYTNTEIAEMLGTSRSSVGVTLHRCRERLKEELAERAEEARASGGEPGADEAAGDNGRHVRPGERS